MKDECEGHELLDLNRLFVKTAKMHRRIFQYEFQKLGLTELKYRINQAFRQIDDCLFEGFTSSERGQMKEYLERMYENLRRKEIEAHD